NKTDTNLFMCQVDKSLVSHKRMLMFCPPLTESELGFEFCLTKIIRLSTELSLPINLVCIERTKAVIEAYLSKNKTSTVVHFERHTDWDDLSKLSAFVKNNDLIVFVSARQGEVSYRYSFDRIPKKLGNVYSQFNRILIFPRRRGGHSLDEYEEVPTSPILRRLGQGIGNIFTKDK